MKLRSYQKSLGNHSCLQRRQLFTPVFEVSIVRPPPRALYSIFSAWVLCEDINTLDSLPLPPALTLWRIGLFFSIHGGWDGVHCKSKTKVRFYTNIGPTFAGNRVFNEALVMWQCFFLWYYSEPSSMMPRIFAKMYLNFTPILRVTRASHRTGQMF